MSADVWSAGAYLYQGSERDPGCHYHLGVAEAFERCLSLKIMLTEEEARLLRDGLDSWLRARVLGRTKPLISAECAPSGCQVVMGYIHKCGKCDQ